VKTLVVLQPGYLPWVGYFDLMHRADVFVHYDDVPFDKHGWRNRNRVKGSTGPVWLTVPVLHSGRTGQLIQEVEVDGQQNWRRKHVATISQLYARAPFLSKVLPRLSSLLEQPRAHLVDLDLEIAAWVAGELGISTPCHRASVLGIRGDRNGRLIDLCRHFGAERYLSGNAARDYLDIDRFRAAGIQVAWHDYEHPTYVQLHGEFVPYLSVLDLMLNTGPQALSILSRCP
jgi:hypothetical protein